MQYQSIIRLFEYCNINYGNDLNVGRAKKILSAEFSVASGGIITIDNFDYSKNDVLEELESPGFTERLRCHKLIWKCPSLLNCLELNNVYFSDVHTWAGLKNDTGFLEFVSPYFAVTFDKVMDKILNHPADFQEAKRWLNLLVFVNNPVDEDEALSSLRVFLLDTIKMLRNVNSTTYISILPQITLWAEQPSASFINRLPVSFYRIKDDLVRAFVNFIHCIYSSTNRTLCYNISFRLTMITGLDQDLRNTIQHNHKIFGSSNNRSRGCLGYLRFLGFIPLIIAVIKFLFMFLSGVFGDKNKHNDQPVLNIPAVEVYEKFTSGDFLELRNKNAAIYPAIFDTANMNQDRPLFPVALQYIMVERPDTSLSASINIINNTHNCSLKIYAVNNNSLVDFMVRKGDAISIKINENTLDFAIKIIENTKDPFPLIREMTNITLVSDSLELDMSYRTINFHNKDNSLNRKKIKPSDVTGLTLIVYSKFRLRNDASTLDVRNYMTFRHADWCVVPKRK